MSTLGAANEPKSESIGRKKIKYGDRDVHAPIEGKILT